MESTFCPPNRSNDHVPVRRNSGDGFLDRVDEVSNWRRRGRYSRRGDRCFTRDRRSGHGNFAAAGTLATNCSEGLVITSVRCIVSVVVSVVNSRPRDEMGLKHLRGRGDLFFTRLAFANI